MGLLDQGRAEERKPRRPVAPEEGKKKVEAAPEVSKPYLIQTYPLIEPYAHASILKDPESGQVRYEIIEPTLTAEERRILERLTELLKLELHIEVDALGSKTKAEEYLREQVRNIVKTRSLKLRRDAFDKYIYFLARDFLYLSKIEPLMRDPLIEDISCDGPKVPIYVWHRDYESLPTNVVFKNDEDLDKFVLRLAYRSGRHISLAQPILDAGLPDGNRIHLTFGTEVTRKGSTFTIRKFKVDPLTIVDLIRYGTVSSEFAAMFWFLLEYKASVLVVGGTASGKTTTINCLSMFIKPEAKVVTIEDTPELNLPHENWIQSVARVGFAGEGEINLFDLLKASMRQRPDFIIVGEVRGAEASTLFQAIATGHAGLSSIHADSVASAIRRLTSEPMNLPKTSIPTVNYIILQGRLTLKDRAARRIMSVTEILDVDPRTSEILTNEVFRHEVKDDRLIHAGKSQILERIANSRGIAMPQVNQEIANRKAILEWLDRSNIRNYKDVANYVRAYYRDPAALLRQARLE